MQTITPERFRVVDASKRGPAALSDRDWTTGADALARRIEAFWRERGASVSCSVVSEGRTRSASGPTGQTHFAVRSDMVNGLPRGWRG